jgi:hypothetical protein
MMNFVSINKIYLLNGMPVHIFLYKLRFRGSPCNPRKCIGKNVTLTPMNSPQKCNLPFLSLYVNPSALGDQKNQAANNAKTAPIDKT